MLKRLARSAAAVLLSLVYSAVALAQNTDDSTGSGTPTSGHPGPGPSFVMVFICTVLILFIICKPVRKAPS
jgi:hypothetical protein